ncbi:MAG: DUF4149 domain-containing protein, partial [Rubrivivax sp.]
MAQRLRLLWPALWAGVLLCVALIAAPAPFATLAPEDAGHVVSRIFRVEAWVSLLAAAVWLLLDRSTGRSDIRGLFGGRRNVVAVESALVWASVLCTLIG